MGGGGCCVSNHPIRDFFNDIFCSDSCCVGNSPGPTESEIHAKKVAEELAEMKEKSKKTSIEKEKKIMDYINSSMKLFIGEIEKINQKEFFGEKLNININSIRKKNDQLNNQVIGCISTVLNTRLVQTDKELSIILEERDERKRKDNFDGFIKKIEKQALKTLSKEIENAVMEQSEVVSKEIKIRRKEVNNRMEETIKELTEMMEAKEKNEFKVREKQVEYMYQITLCNLLLEEIDG